MIYATSLKTNHLTNPLGISTTSPSFSWNLVADNGAASILQEYFDLQVSDISGNFTDEINLPLNWEKVPSDLLFGHAYDGKTLISNTTYCWRVRAHLKYGEVTAWSSPTTFHTGALDDNFWQGLWITTPHENIDRAHYFRKTFSVNTIPKRAVIFLAAGGIYHLYINGKKIDDGELEPGQTDYEKRVLYVTYHIESFLQKGENTIAIHLGNGFFNQTKVWLPGKPYGGKEIPTYGKPRFLFQLEMSDEKLSTRIISDNTWVTTPSPVMDNNIYSGEIYDAREEVVGWNGNMLVQSEANSDATNKVLWQGVQLCDSPGGVLVSRLFAPCRVTQSLSPVKIYNKTANETIIDFGQNISGRVRFQNLVGESGDKINFVFAEDCVVDSNGNMCDIDTASTGVFALHLEQTDTYIFKDNKPASWNPQFCWHGFRYVRVTSESSAVIDKFSSTNIIAEVVHTALEPAGSFECSSPILNKLHNMAKWTYRTNLHSIPEDCPARERCGWLADAYIAAETGFYNYDGSAFYEKFLADIESGRNGGIPHDIAPGKRRAARGVTDWVAAGILLPWYLYLYYGDKKLLSRSYPMMKTVIEYFIERSNEGLLSNGRGDWCDPGTSTAASHTPEMLTTTAWFYRTLCIMEKTANIFEYQSDTLRYGSLKEPVKKSFVKNYFNREEGGFGSQTGDALALAFGLVDEEWKESVAIHLKKYITETSGGHMIAGIYGLRYLWGALSEAGLSDIIEGIVSKNSYPSFGDIIQRGATTLWEYWGDKETDEKDGPRSKNHPMMSGYDVWFYQNLLGIRPHEDTPGFRKIVFNPDFPFWISFAKGEYVSVSGKIESSWEREGKTIEWKILIPHGCEGEIVLSKGYKEIKINGVPLDKQKSARVMKSETGEEQILVGSGRVVVSMMNKL